MEETLHKWLLLNGLFVPKHEIEHVLKLHPAYPSLLSLTDTMCSFCPSVVAFQIEECEVDKLNYPLIAYLNKNGGIFQLVTSQREVQKDIKFWTGIVISNTSPVSNNRLRSVAFFLRNILDKLLNEFFTPLIFLFFVFITFFRIGLSFEFFFVLLAACGLFMSYFISINEIKSSINENKVSCVLGDCIEYSKGVARILPFKLSISDIASAYFATSIVVISYLLFSDNNKILLLGFDIIGWVGLAISGISVATLIYLRHFCIYCLVIDLILVSQFVLTKTNV